MIVRRNDRRRRLMSEEYVSTVDVVDSSETASQSTQRSEIEKRAYAFGADRRGQLRTTDLFPKRLWVIVFGGAMLLGILAGLNVLNSWATTWQPLIGEASMHAISLTGPGTLAGWMISMLLMLTGLASLQIFALRKYRCDDYGGTYRVWLIIPPIFFIASIAAIVDFQAIVMHFAMLGQMPILSSESLLPMTVKLSVLALLIVRMLFEVRDSKSAFSMLVVAWLAIAVSTVLDTRWAQQRIASNDLALAYPNALMIGIIALFLTHLLYVRFVYLHANGLIAIAKPQLKTKYATKQSAQSISKRSKAAANNATAKKATATVAEEMKSKTSKLSKTKTTSSKASPAATKAASRSSQPKPSPSIPIITAPAKPAVTKTTTTPVAAAPVKKKSATMSDFQALLKQKQAQQADAAESSASASIAEPTTDSSDHDETIKMTKAQRRKLRKQTKADRRAA